MHDTLSYLQYVSALQHSRAHEPVLVDEGTVQAAHVLNADAICLWG